MNNERIFLSVAMVLSVAAGSNSSAQAQQTSATPSMPQLANTVIFTFQDNSQKICSFNGNYGETVTLAGEKETFTHGLKQNVVRYHAQTVGGEIVDILINSDGKVAAIEGQKVGPIDDATALYYKEKYNAAADVCSGLVAEMKTNFKKSNIALTSGLTITLNDPNAIIKKLELVIVQPQAKP